MTGRVASGFQVDSSDLWRAHDRPSGTSSAAAGFRFVALADDNFWPLAYTELPPTARVWAAQTGGHAWSPGRAPRVYFASPAWSADAGAL